MRKVSVFFAILGACLIALTSCEDNRPAPEIIMSTQQLLVAADGGSDTLTFEILNPREDGMLDVVIPEGNEWIKMSSMSKDGIFLSFTENVGTENRGTVITVYYRYGESEVMAAVNVIQEFVACDFTHNIVTAIFNWYGSTSGKDKNMSNFYIQMCDNEDPSTPGSHTIFFDLFTAEVPKDNLPVAGTYTPAECKQETDFTFCNYDTFIWKMNASGTAYEYLYGFIEGEIVVKRSGKTISIRALLTDEAGKVHWIRYDGNPNIVDGTMESNLASDWNATVNGSETYLMAVCHGDGYTDNSNTWQLQIWPEVCVPKDYVFFGEAYTPTNIDETTGFPDGMELSMDTDGKGVPYTYSEGFSGFQGTWLLQVYESTEASITFGAQTPLKEGKISFKLNEDGTYDMLINAVDDNRSEPHKINVLFDNIPVYFLNPAETSSMETSSARVKPSMKRAR